MAIQLNPAPPREVKPSLAVPAAVAQRVGSIPPTVLRVPEVASEDGTIAVVVATEHEEAKPSRNAEASRSEPATRRSVTEIARETLLACKSQAASAWQAIDWAKIVAWMGRPVVTYTSAVVIVLAVIVAIVMHPRAPATPEQPKIATDAGSVDEAKPESQHKHEHDGEPQHVHEHSLATEQPRIAPPDIERRPSVEVVKLPPVITPGTAIEANIFPRQNSGVADRLNTEPTTGSAERPNVARLEGRILTPQTR